MKITNMPISMTEVQARREAIDILEEEANQLCPFGELGDEGKTLTHRGRIAISREIQRLRLIANALKGEGE